MLHISLTFMFRIFMVQDTVMVLLILLLNSNITGLKYTGKYLLTWSFIGSGTG